MISVRNEFYKIAAFLETRVLENNDIHIEGEQLYAYDGNKTELEAVIFSKDKEDINFNKYPCIILEMPFKVVPNEWNRLNDVSVEGLRILIVASAKQESRNEQRFSEVIEPLLYPILEELMKAIGDNNNVQSCKLVEYTAHPYYGTNQQIANDIWETLDVRLNMNFKQNC